VYPFDNRVVVTQHSNQEVVMERSIEIDAVPQEIWEAISTDAGREAWLDDDREVHVETVEEPTRLVWWWAQDEAWTRVEVTLVPLVSTTRVTVRETVPAFPLTALATAWTRV
jgi:uncharacterized protein YndB with AHSA1/START domain